jgi:hypothetical protein
MGSWLNLSFSFFTLQSWAKANAGSRNRITKRCFIKAIELKSKTLIPNATAAIVKLGQIIGIYP